MINSELPPVLSPVLSEAVAEQWLTSRLEQGVCHGHIRTCSRLNNAGSVAGYLTNLIIHTTISSRGDFMFNLEGFFCFTALRLVNAFHYS